MKSQLLHRGLLLFGGLAVSVSPHSMGQGAPAEEDIVELSPFVVDGSQDQGYRATNTLAGTRLRTSLKDLGTSVQVITKDFLDDVAANGAGELLVYTTNTEVGGSGGNFSGAELDQRTDTAEFRARPQNATRVRGLFTADLTRGYFKTLIPFDSYNTSNVDINRGSNATLFGLGSPAGIINNGLVEANFKDSGNFTTRFDAEGSIRASIDINRVLLDDKLAIRIALLKDDKEFKQRPAYEDTERLYTATKWKLAKNTTLKASYETGQVDANRPDPVSPKENITPWLLGGKPILDQRLATGIGLTGGTGIFVDLDKNPNTPLQEAGPKNIMASRWSSYVQYADGGFINEGKWTVDANGFINAPNIPFGNGSTNNLGLSVPRFFTQGGAIWADSSLADPNMPGIIGQYSGNRNVAGDALSLLGDGQKENREFVSVRNIDAYYPNYNRQGFVSTSQFDFTNQLFAGVTPFQKSEFDATTLTLEQTFMDNKFGIDVSYDKQQYDDESYAPLQDNASQIYVDVNVMLPDGRLNPNLGRPFVNGRSSKGARETSYETLRATAFAQHDFAKQFDSGIGGWLGRHVLTGLADENKQSALNYTQNQIWNDPDVLRALISSGDHSSFNAFLNPLVYVGPSLLNIKSLDEAKIEPISGVKLWRPGETASITFWDPGVQPGTVDTAATDAATIRNTGKLVTKDVTFTTNDRGSSLTNTDISSQAAVLQSYFFGGNIVSTIGYRKDTVDSEVYNSPPKDAFNNELLSQLESGGNRAEASGSEDRWSYGAVAHWPSQWFELPKNTDLTIHYAESTNFTLDPSRVNFDNKSIDSPSGATEEKGFSLSMFENKLNVRVNWYETSLLNRNNAYNAGQLTNNAVFQRADFYYQSAANSTDPVYQKFNRAVGTALLAGATAGESAIYNVIVEKDGAGQPIGVNYVASIQAKDTEDVTSKGKEFEVTYNPTKNWRIFFNASQQETVRSNVLPFTGGDDGLIALRRALYDAPIPGYEWMTIGRLANDAKNENDNWVLDPANKIYGPVADPVGTVYRVNNDFLNEQETNYLTAKAQEGSRATEQREWRFNVVTNYRFDEGRFKGLSVGGGYRWQDEVSIGFPFIVNERGQTVGDVKNPIYADAEGDVDLFASYNMPFFKDIGKWKLQLNVRNAFASESDIIPLQIQGDAVTYSRVRFAPQREFILTSTFAF